MELRVFVQGTPGNHAIVTVHDIGLNHRSCFAGFLGHPRAEGLLRICCFYHIDLPGQSDGDVTLFTDRTYPTMTQLGDAVGAVVRHCSLTHFYAIGVGAGVNVLVRYLIQRRATDPDLRALLSISPILSPPGWYEWAFEKYARLKIAMGPADRMPDWVIDANLDAYFGAATHNTDISTIARFRAMMAYSPSPGNYAALLKAWMSRGNLLKMLKVKPVTVPTLTFYAGQSNRAAHVTEVAGSAGVFKGPQSEMLASWKGGDLVQEEDAGSVLQAFCAMLQGFSVLV
mmetsp:Transcript_31336/g.94142  ORF Transcript_31336/g.94142 Transcript_31336/m.94142 type:complete len:285 (-) Transcript_31336:178-1032(-)